MNLIEVLATFQPNDRLRIRDAVNVAGAALADYRLAGDGSWFIDHRETVVICRTAIMSAVPLPHFTFTTGDTRWPWRLELSGSG